VDRLKYELCVLQALRERLRCKEIWVVGANRYRNPDEDLPANFEAQRKDYYAALSLPLPPSAAAKSLILVSSAPNAIPLSLMILRKNRSRLWIPVVPS